MSFRKERGTTNAMYTVNRVVEQELKKKGEKVYAFCGHLENDGKIGS